MNEIIIKVKQRNKTNETCSVSDNIKAADASTDESSTVDAVLLTENVVCHQQLLAQIVLEHNTIIAIC